VRLIEDALGRERVRAVGVLDYAELTPSDALLLLYPTTSLDVDSLTAFLADGGRVAVLDDFGSSGGLLARFGIRQVAPPLEPARTLRSDPDLALAVPSVRVVAGAETGRHPIVDGVSEVVTNHPRALAHPELTTVLELPARDGSSAALAVTGVIAGKGRFVTVADSSIFMNLMLRYPGNRALALGLARYLTAREPGEPASGGRLIIAAGDFDERGIYGAPGGPLSSVLTRLRELFDRLRAVDEQGLPEPLLLALGAAIGLWLVAEQLRSEWPQGRAQLPGFARLQPPAAQLGLAGRAEVLGAEGVNPLLALVEMESALREQLDHRLGLTPGGAPAEVLPALERAGMPRTEASRAVALLAELRLHNASLLYGRRRRPSASRLSRLSDEAGRLLLRLSELERRR
jgi:hypothetical protein